MLEFAPVDAPVWWMIPIHPFIKKDKNKNQKVNIFITCTYIGFLCEAKTVLMIPIMIAIISRTSVVIATAPA